MRRRPNVIVIITDDQGYGDLGVHGNPWLETPHLDQLARESVRLENHHHDPLCSPSRAALLTGQYAARNGVWHVIQGRHLLHPRAETMADIFAAEGYRTGMFGKWHLGDNYPFAPHFRGFEEALCHRGGGVGELPDYWGNRYIDDVYFLNGAPQQCHGYCSDVFFDAAADFITENAAEPFIVYLATNAMHAPHIVPEAYAAPYAARGIPPRRANFYGMIANFDENMGRLLRHLDDLRLGDSTLILFTSDHGTAAGYDAATGAGYNAGMRGTKGSVYDGGHRVSCFLRWRGRLPAGQRICDLSAHIDILPTLVELCELDSAAASSFDGRSLAPLLRGEAPALPERPLVVQLQPDQPQKWHHCAVLRGDWRLINGQELYDISQDRAQAKDIASEQPALVAALRRDYEQWWRAMAAHFEEAVAIPIGTRHENPVMLSARDWHPAKGTVPWMQTWIDDPAHDAEGFWLIDVTAPGRYTFELRLHPREAPQPLEAGSAQLDIAAIKRSKAIPAGDCGAVFALDLPAGLTTLRALIASASSQRQRGAYYVYIQKEL